MKQPTTSRFVLVCALFAALFSVGLMTSASDAEAQRRPGYGRQDVAPRGGFSRGDVRREILRREVFRREAVRPAPARWGRNDRFGRQPAPRWQSPRGRYARGRW
jgi:hypothetical protein